MNASGFSAELLAGSHCFVRSLVLVLAVSATACGPPVSAQIPTPEAMRIAARPLSSEEQLFLDSGCGGCHTLAGLPGATGVAGPNLTHVALRPTLAGDSIPNTPQTMARWLLDPAAIKPDARMPSVGLSASQAQELAAFLFSVH